MSNIKKISDLETYSVRQVVLRIGKPLDYCRFDGDDLESTCHFGYYLNQELVGIISLFKKQNNHFLLKSQFQIRGMAVLENHRKKGIGEELVIFCESYCKKYGPHLIWFNARIVAVGFYEKLGYTKKGTPFEINGIGEHFLMYKETGYE